MLKNPGDRFTRFHSDGPMPDNLPSDEGPAKKYFDSDRKMARDFKRVFNPEEGQEPLSVQFRKYQKWYSQEYRKDQMTVIGYQHAVSDCWFNNGSDYKASCRGVFEDYMASLNVFKAKYGTV